MNDFIIKLPLAMRFYLIGLIYRNSRMSCVCLASLVEVAHDRQNLSFVFGVSIFETDVGMVCRAFVKDGYLLIDDTIWQRYGKKLAGVSFVWDSTIGKKVLGTNVVLLVWTDGKRRIPLSLRIWQKGGRNALGNSSSRHHSKVCVI